MLSARPCTGAGLAWARLAAVHLVAHSSDHAGTVHDQRNAGITFLAAIGLQAAGAVADPARPGVPVAAFVTFC